MRARTLAGTLATSLAYQGVRDIARSTYRTARNMVFPYRRRYYGAPSRGRYRMRYRVRRARRGRYRRRYKRSLPKRARIGMPVGYATTKRNLVVQEADLNRNTRTLYSFDLTQINRTTTNAINLRQRDMINLRGFKMDWGIRSGSLLAQPLYVHFAILSHTSNTSVPTTAAAGCIDDQNFFRGSGPARAIDFSTSLDGLQVNKLAINQDIYSILKRWRVRIEPTVNPTGIMNTTRTTHLTGKRYVKLNRQVRYDDPSTGQVPTAGRTFLVYWADGVAGVTSGTTAFSNAYAVDLHIVAYFNEPMGC